MSDHVIKVEWLCCKINHVHVLMQPTQLLPPACLCLIPLMSLQLWLSCAYTVFVIDQLRHYDPGIISAPLGHR